jgi:hypothetical protein
MSRIASISVIAASLELILVLVVAPPAAALTYTFRNVADNSAGQYASFNAPAINDAGTVVFRATRYLAGSGIYTGHDPVADAVVTTDGPYSGFGDLPAINSAGTVAFVAGRDSGGSGLFTGPDPVADAVVTSDGPYFAFTQPAINNAGTVAFRAGLDAGGQGIFTGPDATADAVATSDGPYASLQGPAIDGAGTVVFFAQRDGGGQGIFTGSDPVADAVATTDGPYSSFGITPAINGTGTMAFVAGQDSGGSAIFTGPDPVVDAIDLSGFQGVNNLAINDAGRVAFMATFATGLSGIYTGPDRFADNVIEYGDFFFGSHVAGLDFFRGLNNYGDIAVHYELADGQEGIAVASVVPEPSTILLLVFGGLGVLVARRIPITSSGRFRVAPRHVLVAGVVVCCASVPLFAHAAAIRTVALSGQQAPGTPDGVGYFSFGTFQGAVSQPVINNAGQVAFGAFVLGNGVDATNNFGIWSEGSGTLGMVAREGNQAPGMPDGELFSSFGVANAAGGNNYLLFNNAGQTAFNALLTGSTSGWGFWSEGSGQLALVARTGDLAPGAPSGATFTPYAFFHSPQLNDAGRIAFRNYWSTDSAAGYGIWTDRSGTLQPTAIQGLAVPGIPGGATISIPIHGPAMNNAAQIAFMASITGPGVTSSDNAAIFSEGSGGLALVARRGDPAPGLADGVRFISFNRPVLNDAGAVAFVATTGGGWTLYSNVSGDLTLIANTGQQVPGLPPGVTFAEFSSWQFPILNDIGHLVFRARLLGGGIDNQSLWLARDGALELVARTGEHAPGTPDGVLFQAHFGEYYSMPFLNDADQIAFRSTLVGIGIDSTNDEGIWASDRSGVLQLIARSGDVLEVAPGDFRTISSLELERADSTNTPRPNNSTALNELGQLVFVARFTDGSSGIFVSNAVAVPEPSTIALLLLGLFLAIRFPRYATSINK